MHSLLGSSFWGGFQNPPPPSIPKKSPEIPLSTRAIVGDGGIFMALELHLIYGSFDFKVLLESLLSIQTVPKLLLINRKEAMRFY